MGNNYLNKDAIVCHGGNEYTNNFCYLHGSSHVPQELQAELSLSSSCIREDEGGEDQDKVRTTHYYIWLPFILAIIATLTKLPGILWKNVLERGIMEKLVKDMDEDGSKTAKRFHKVVLGGGKTSFVQAMIYNYGFAFCEVLNLVVILVSQSILNSLFTDEYANYGVNVQTYRSFVPNEGLPERTSPANPMCHLFPTEVSCSVKTGGIGGNTNKENILCLLPNNVFYQYYFLIVWWWWVALIFITCLAIVYRLVQILLPQFGRMRLEAMFVTLGVNSGSLEKFDEMDLSTSKTFLLIRLIGNLKGSQVSKLFDSVDNNGEEGQALINQEESTEMTSVVTD